MRPLRKPRSSAQTVRITCRACGERHVVRGELPVGEITHVKIFHEDWCPFFVAVQSGQETASAWLLEHGYPIAYQVAPA